MKTSLIGRKVLQGYSGEIRGAIVAVFTNRGDLCVVVEWPVAGSSDKRTQLSIEMLGGLILAPVDDT